MEVFLFFTLLNIGDIVLVWPISFLFCTLGAVLAGKKWTWSAIFGIAASFIIWVSVGVFLATKCLIQTNCL